MPRVVALHSSKKIADHLADDPYHVALFKTSLNLEFRVNVNRKSVRGFVSSIDSSETAPQLIDDLPKGKILGLLVLKDCFWFGKDYRSKSESPSQSDHRSHHSASHRSHNSDDYSEQTPSSGARMSQRIDCANFRKYSPILQSDPWILGPFVVAVGQVLRLSPSEQLEMDGKLSLYRIPPETLTTLKGFPRVIATLARWVQEYGPNLNTDIRGMTVQQPFCEALLRRIKRFENRARSMPVVGPSIPYDMELRRCFVCSKMIQESQHGRIDEECPWKLHSATSCLTLDIKEQKRRKRQYSRMVESQMSAKDRARTIKFAELERLLRYIHFIQSHFHNELDICRELYPRWDRVCLAQERRDRFIQRAHQRRSSFWLYEEKYIKSVNHRFPLINSFKINEPLLQSSQQSDHHSFSVGGISVSLTEEMCASEEDCSEPLNSSLQSESNVTDVPSLVSSSSSDPNLNSYHPNPSSQLFSDDFLPDLPPIPESFDGFLDASVLQTDDQLSGCSSASSSSSSSEK